MKINVGKLDSTIAKLQELRRLATDPALAPFVKVTGHRANSNAASAPAGAGTAKNGRGQLKAAVLAACAQLRQFTAKEVFAVLKKDGYEFTGPNGEKSVANALRALVAKHEIRVVEEGSGRRPTKYAA